MKPLWYLGRWIFDTGTGFRYYLDQGREFPCHHGSFKTVGDAKKAIEKARGQS
jgi:hypothetical protein